jgi:hypothetical protein
MSAPELNRVPSDYKPLCYVHGGEKVLVEGADGCQAAVCVELRALPEPELPFFRIKRLKQMNADGITDNEMRQDIYESARRDGRDIQRAR